MVARKSRIAIAASVSLAVLAWAVAGPARAESVQKMCGEEWAAAKKAGTVPAGQAWPGFLGECKKRHAAGTAAPATPVATPAAAPAPAAKPAATSLPAPTAAAGTGNVADDCKAEYTAGKASGSVPKGTNYFKFLSECKKRHAAGSTKPETPAAAATPAPAAPAPAPTQTAAPAAPATPPTAPGAKPKSPGREAFIERERQCGAKWKTIKGTSALPAGITTWPKYLSYCNARLKAGQTI